MWPIEISSRVADVAWRYMVSDHMGDMGACKIRSNKHTGRESKCELQNCMSRRAFGMSNKSLRQHLNPIVDAMVASMQYTLGFEHKNLRFPPWTRASQEVKNMFGQEKLYIPMWTYTVNLIFVVHFHDKQVHFGTLVEEYFVTMETRRKKNIPTNHWNCMEPHKLRKPWIHM